MAKTIYSAHYGDDIEVEFVAAYGPCDDIAPDVDILSLSILGVKVNLSELPKPLQAAILALQPETI